MGLNRQLIDTIKGHFAQKSTAELQEIARLKDLDRWSEEAFVGAEEVLADRVAGRAKEPRVPVKDVPPPSAEERFGALISILGYAAGGLIGGLIAHTAASPEGQPANRPVPFGSNTAWLAVETTDTASVATALGLRQLREATWAEGVVPAQESDVFVTPPLGDWTLAVGTPLLPPEAIETFVRPLLERMSQQFKEAQHFCTSRTAELYSWARAQKGRLIRGYGWFGQRGLTIWDEGAQTKWERDLGMGSASGGDAPDEGRVTQLASLWSVDPTSLDDHFQEPAMGLLGTTVTEPAGGSDPRGRPWLR